jgi:hypothetical protein
LCIHEKFEYSCDVTNKAHPHPSCLVYFVLNAQPFFINFDMSVCVDRFGRGVGEASPMLAIDKRRFEHFLLLKRIFFPFTYFSVEI